MLISRRLPSGVMLACTLAAAASGAMAQQLRESFDLHVPQAPQPFTVDGRSVIAYELHITNFADVDLDITRLDVLDGSDSRRVIGRFTGEGLERLLGRPGQRAAESGLNVVRPGMRIIAYLWLSLDGSQLPRSLQHRLRYRADGVDVDRMGDVQGGRTEVHARDPVVLAPPLRGGPWVAIYDPDMVRGHRRVLLALDGTARIPARFTIDWMKADTDGRFARGDGTAVTDFHGYGEEVLAVGDAVVVAVRDTMAERGTVEFVGHGLENASGNYVTIDLGAGRFVTYEHLRPGSVRVAVGDTVRAGHVIAELGNTGDSVGPHLHMHVSNGAAPLDGEGLPFVLRSFELVGRYDSISRIGRGPWGPAGSPVERRMEMPAANSVVRFRR